jgi:hypothetical protein
MERIKAVNNLEELNNFKVGDQIPTWDILEENDIMKVSDNSKKNLSVIKIHYGFGKRGYWLDEYTLDKSRIKFIDERVVLDLSTKKIYEKGNENYQSKLNLINRGIN